MAALDGSFLSELAIGRWSCNTFLQELLKAQCEHGLSVQTGGTCVTPAYTHTATLCHCAVTLQQLHQVGWDGFTWAAGQVDLVEMHA